MRFARANALAAQPGANHAHHAASDYWDPCRVHPANALKYPQQDETDNRSGYAIDLPVRPQRPMMLVDYHQFWIVLAKMIDEGVDKIPIT